MTNDRAKEVRDAIEREKYPQRKRTSSELRALAKEARKVLEFGDEKELMRFLRGLGLKDESREFVEAVNVFRSLRRGKP